MESLPVDMSHPAVKDYLSLVRLQVLTPLSLLLNIATVLVCTFVTNPSLRGVLRLYPTSITPHFGVISAYVAVIYLGQIGYCLWLVIAQNAESKRAFVKGVGFTLVLANLTMAVWAICWVMQWFLACTILQGIIMVLLLYSNIALLVYHSPTFSRPWDMAFIHAPLRFFFVLPFTLLFPLCLFIALHLTYTPTAPGPPAEYPGWHGWTGFGVLMGTNALGLFVIMLRRDIVWCVAATWICVSIWSSRPKPGPVYIAVIACTVLHPIGLLASYAYAMLYQRRQGVYLPEDDSHPGLYRNNQANRRRDANENIEGGPTEIDEHATWG